MAEFRGLCLLSENVYCFLKNSLTLSKVKGQSQAVSALDQASCHTLGVSRTQPEHLCGLE